MLDGSGTRKLGGRDPIRALQRIFSFTIVGLFVALFPSRAHAYSWMIKHGYSGCPVCHADPSGGELLTSYGRLQSGLLLRMHYGKQPGDAAAAVSVSASPAPSSDADDSDDEAPTKAKAPAAKKAAPAKKAKPGADDDDDEKTDANSGEDDDDQADGDKKPSGAKSAAAKKGEDDDDDATEAAPATAASTSGGASAEEDTGTKGTGFLWGLFDTPDWLLLGGSYRHLAVYKSPSGLGTGAVTRSGSFATFPMMADVYGQIQIGNFRAEGSLGIIRVGVGSPYGRNAQVTANQGDQWNLLSRTHWLAYDIADGRYTVRAGRMNLPFGIRIPEHTMWVRQFTHTDRESAQQDGVALAFTGDDWRGELMGIVGNYQVNPDKFRDRGYSGYLEYMVSPHAALGISSLVTHAQRDHLSLDANSTRQAHGLLARAAFSEQLVLLTEADMLLQTNHELGYVGMAQFDWEAVQGLHFMITGEALDQGFNTVNGGARVAGQGQPAFGGWGSIDWFCFTHVEVRADVYKRQNDAVTALGQLHVFL